MKRRSFLFGSVALSAAAVHPALHAQADGPAQLGAAAGAITWQAQFDAASAPWTLGYRTPRHDFAPTPAQVRGRFPPALSGTLYRTGPAGHDLGGVRYHEWFDGDGMAQQFIIDGASVRHRGRYIATAKRTSEVRAGRRLVNTFGTAIEGGHDGVTADDSNPANTSMLPLAGEVLALWEGGSPTRLDPRTLDTKGVKSWSDKLKGMPFAAHPKVDPDGTVWNFGAGVDHGVLILYEIAPDGTLRRGGFIPVADVPMIHDFAVTERHLVFLMPPLVHDPRLQKPGVAMLDAYTWRPEMGMRVLVVDKQDWNKRQTLALPAGFVFHLGNAWEEAGAAGPVITVDYVHADRPDVLFQTTRDVMRGYDPQVRAPRLMVATLDLGSGTASQKPLPVDGEFPRIDPRRVGLRHRHVVHATQAARTRPGWAAAALTNVETGHSERHVYGESRIAEEHIFVPDGNGAGWVLGTSLDLLRKCTVLSCFAADRMADGPVAEATLPYALPLGLHGAFVVAG